MYCAAIESAPHVNATKVSLQAKTADKEAASGGDMTEAQAVKQIRHTLFYLRDRICPGACVFRDQPADDGRICGPCRRLLPWNRQFCQRCGQVTLAAQPPGVPCATAAQSPDLQSLTPNKDAYVRWVSMEEAAAIAIKNYGDEDLSELLYPFIEMIESDYDGELEEFQFRFHVGRVPYILRGVFDGKIARAYLIQDGEYDFIEWVNIPSVLTGPFIALDREAVDQMSDVHQKAFEKHFGTDVMLEDMQLSARRCGCILIGAMRWRAPRTHLHALIVIKF
jgi:hypothetical protein